MKVSVVCLTYNHIGFIAEALESFVRQQTNFPFEVIVHDDASTDGTTEVVKDYAARYPHIIRPVLQDENQWRKGKTLSKTFIYPLIQGEYVAFCEGDDYWTDPLKLQKQVDALDARPDASVCFHPVTVHWEDGSEPDSEFPSKKYRFYKDELELSDLLKRNFIQTNTVMYRWRFQEEPLDLIPDGILPGDWFLHLLHAQKGKILFLPDNMGVYRRHKQGLWNGAGKSKEWYRKVGLLHLRFYDEVERVFQVDQSEVKHELMIACYAYAIRDNEKEWLEKLQQAYPLEISSLHFSAWKMGLLSILSVFFWGQEKKRIKAQRRLIKKWRKIFQEKNSRTKIE